MYNGTMNISLVGLSDEYVHVLKNSKVEPPLKLEFLESQKPDSKLIADSECVIACSNDGDAPALVREILDCKNDECELIVIAPNEAFASLGELASSVRDFWSLPLLDEELSFHFNRWQKSFKQKLDLWETSQFLDATIDSIPSLVWYKTRDGIHEKVNSSFCKTVNKTKEQVQGQRHAYIWDVEEDDPACIESENEVMASRKTCVSEETVLAGDSEMLLTTYKSPLYDRDGSVMGTVGVGIDITQERAYENDLVEKNRSLETIFTSLDCGVLTHSLDGSRILGVNKKALDILGFGSEEELSEQGFDMVASTVVTEDAIRLRKEISQLTEVGDTLSTEYSVCHVGGDMLHILGNVKVIEKDGEKYYQRFLLDITAQKELEEEKAQRSRNLIRALSGDYIFVCVFDLSTGKGEVMRFSRDSTNIGDVINEYPTLEETKQGLIDKGIYEQDRELIETSLSSDYIREALAMTDRFDKLYRKERDGVVEFRQLTVVKTDNWGDNQEVIMGFRNVDQETREELEQKTLLEQALGDANRANAAKSTFLLNMSHDIRTPMNAIVGFTNLAESHINDTEDVKEYLEKIKTSSNHLLNLINDILDMSRIEQGKVTLEEDACNISGVLDDLYSMLNHEAESKGLVLSVDTSKVVHPEVICDRLKLNQVILNLLGNSIKFTNAGGSIDASIEELDGAPKGFGSYRIVVKDTGIGMPEDFLEHLFDPFERVKTQTNSGIQGSGLGMAIVKSLLDMMNGSIDVQSELGVGTTFTVNLTLKLAKGDEIVEQDKQEEPVVFTPERASRYRILLVDDNSLNREIAENILVDAGFNVDMAINGQDAIDKLVQAGGGCYDLVLMDIQMPVMNGYEAASVIRSLEDRSIAEVPILAVTADAFEEDRMLALEHGMNGHLPKPIEISRLFEIMDSLLG